MRNLISQSNAVGAGPGRIETDYFLKGVLH